jgi:hypothetical protein
MSTLQSELDYLKGLAESGARGPMKNGAVLFWAGLLYAGASLAEYGVALNLLPQTTMVQMTIWFGASLLFAIAAVISLRGKSGRGNVSSTAYNSAWSAVGIGIGVLMLSVFLLSRQVQDIQAVAFMIAPVVLAFYGMGWWVSAKISEQGWLKLVSIGCFLAAPVMAVMAGRSEQLLAYAAALILFAAIPGFVIMRAARN